MTDFTDFMWDFWTLMKTVKFKLASHVNPVRFPSTGDDYPSGCKSIQISPHAGKWTPPQAEDLGDLKVQGASLGTGLAEDWVSQSFPNTIK